MKQFSQSTFAAMRLDGCNISRGEGMTRNQKVKYFLVQKYVIAMTTDNLFKNISVKNEVTIRLLILEKSLHIS